MKEIEYPLNEIYAKHARPVPKLSPLLENNVPHPYRDLLVHEEDMTPKMCSFHDSAVYVDALFSFTEDDVYYREVLLKLPSSNKGVLYGGIRIDLSLLPEEAAAKVLAEKEPFGGILEEFKVEHLSRPSGYFEIVAGDFIAASLSVEPGAKLYGRRNTLYTPEMKSIAEIVEILPRESVVKKYDVVIIGAGPSGTSSATILAEAGLKTIILEKEKFPRYRVGESMIPYCYYPLERLGMTDKMKKSHFQRKLSVQFVGESGRVSAPFYFMKHMKHEAAETYQVKRSEFDQLMLENAQERGADFVDDCPVKELIRDESGKPCAVRVENNGTEEIIEADMFLDCTGREAVTMHRNRWRVADPMLKKMAVWTYFKGAMRDPGDDEGATTVAYIPEKGWFWYLPLHDDMVSVGVVAEPSYLFNETRDLEEIFYREVENNAWIKEHLSCGERVEDFRVTSEFSYRSKHCAEDNLLLVGDAFAFLDPVFSSGMFLALYSGVLAGDAVVEAFKKKDLSAGAFTEYSNEFRKGLEAMRSLVYAFYNPDFSFGKFIKKYPHLHSDLTDCLIGNLYRDFDELFEAMKDFAEMPEALEHGKPFIKDAVEAKV
jgi:flavin-dependent dehydrogenase/chorismate-pyruvate lyase